MTDDYVLWNATVRAHSFADRLRAAEVGGFAEFGIDVLDYYGFRHGEDAMSLPEVRDLVADSDVDVTVIDPYTQWTPEFDPPTDLPGLDPEFLRFTEAEFFGMAAELDVDSMTAFEPFTADLGPEAGAEAFGTLCDRAAEDGIDVHLEFIPGTGVPDLERAWEIVRRADRENGGIVFDTYHYFRGGRDDELLATIPGEKIFRVQLMDAHAEPVGPLIEDMLNHRLPLGEGDLDLAPVVRTLDEVGGLSSVGYELFNVENDELSAAEAGRRAGEDLRAFLDETLG
jgi:4-hydroxyphenylpyruvate dioxygenase